MKTTPNTGKSNPSTLMTTKNDPKEYGPGFGGESPGENLSAPVSVRLPSGFREALGRKAMKHGVSPSAEARRILVQGLTEEM